MLQISLKCSPHSGRGKALHLGDFARERGESQKCKANMQVIYNFLKLNNHLSKVVSLAVDLGIMNFQT